MCFFLVLLADAKCNFVSWVNYLFARMIGVLAPYCLSGGRIVALGRQCRALVGQEGPRVFEIVLRQ